MTIIQLFSLTLSLGFWSKQFFLYKPSISTQHDIGYQLLLLFSYSGKKIIQFSKTENKKKFINLLRVKLLKNECFFSAIFSDNFSLLCWKYFQKIYNLFYIRDLFLSLYISMIGKQTKKIVFFSFCKNIITLKSIDKF